MDSKKISFGFTKINKKPNLLLNNDHKNKTSRVELITCLEGQEIKLVEEKPCDLPLVIPIKENQKTSNALASLLKRRAVLLGEEEPELKQQKLEAKKIESTSTDTLEQKAAQELLAELKPNNGSEQSIGIVLPIVKPDELPLEGAKESTFDDYESIPIEQFGLALLRGMGWVDPPKKNNTVVIDDSPFVRPKGMGLGADKALKPKPLLIQPDKNEVLMIKKHAYVRILGGKHKDMYGQIEGFDDHAGRVIVKLAIGGVKEALNEFLCQPVSKKEYSEYGKCINTSKYEAYKKLENENGQIILKNFKNVEKTQSKQESENVDVTRHNKYSNKFDSKHNSDTEKIVKKYENEKIASYNDRKRDYQQSSSSNRSTADNAEHRRRYKSRSPIQNRNVQESYKHNKQELNDKFDSESSYERMHKKKSSKKSKHKKKKSKSELNRKRYSSSSSSELTDTSEDNKNRHNKKYKKSKKNKKKRYSRSPSGHKR